jgi:PIN domain nuclease of toxin-antitoxin system
VTFLLDTHALLWFLDDDSQLSQKAKAFIADPTNQKFVSVASCWEIAIKAGIGKLKLAESASTFLERELRRNCFDLLAITLSHATAVETLPPHHKDPFDRMLAVQALENNIGLISHDVQFDAYGVARWW